MKKAILSMMLIFSLFVVGCNDIVDAPIQNTESDTNDIEEASKVEETSPFSESETALEAHVSSSMDLKKVGQMQYYLYTPSNPETNMPLIIYLHGGTNKRSEVGELLNLEGFPKFLYEGYYGDLRAYVAVPKLDESLNGWVNAADSVRDMIKSISDNYGVDMKKIALTGHSLGGTGTYQLQLRFPNTFACIAPMSGSVKITDSNIETLAKTKIWAFVGSEDKIVDPTSSIDAISALKEKNADANITVLDGANHFEVPSLAYKNEALIEWLVNCGN